MKTRVDEVGELPLERRESDRCEELGVGRLGGVERARGLRLRAAGEAPHREDLGEKRVPMYAGKPRDSYLISPKLA